METISDRIRVIIKSLGYTKTSDFTKDAGFENSSTISNYLNDKNANPAYDKLVQVVNAFPQINPMYLFTGIGPVLIDGGEEVAHFGKRVLMICELEGISKEEFAKKIGRTDKVINSLLVTKPIKVAKDLLCDILEAFPNVRPTWLVFGNEPAQRTESKSVKVEVGNQMVELIINIIPKP